MKILEQEISQLEELFENLVNHSPMLRRGSDWSGEWEGWERGTTWHPDKCGVYVLWEDELGINGEKSPVYVGEGILGTRVHASFHGRESWQFAQMTIDDRISGGNKETNNRRKLLERLCITVLEPKENLD